MLAAPTSRRSARALLGAGAAALLLLAAPAGGSAQGATAAVGKASGERAGLAAARTLGGPSCKRLGRPGTSAHTARVAARVRRIERRRVKRCAPKAAASAATGPLYWGAWVGSQLTGDEAPWDMGAIAKFESMAGKAASAINFSSPFADCSKAPCDFYEFPKAEMESIRAHGSMPFFSWASQATPASLNQPDFQLADVIAGTYDDYIREFAEGARDWGHPFFLRFNWEMNGGWFPWSEIANGNGPGQYIAAWRHVHDIFAAVGA